MNPAHTVLHGRAGTVTIGSDQPFCVIGERINPTGRKQFAQELRDGDLSTVTADAQVMGADADSVVLVVPARASSKQVRQAVAGLDSVGAPLLGTVLVREPEPSPRVEKARPAVRQHREDAPAQRWELGWPEEADGPGGPDEPESAATGPALHNGAASPSPTARGGGR